MTKLWHAFSSVTGCSLVLGLLYLAGGGAAIPRGASRD
jgi:hypothetical protein